MADQADARHDPLPYTAIQSLTGETVKTVAGLLDRCTPSAVALPDNRIALLLVVKLIRNSSAMTTVQFKFNQYYR